MRAGFSLIEVALVVSIVGVVTLITIPTLGRSLDRLATDRAASEVATFYHRARLAALLRSSPVRIEFGQDSLIASYDRGMDTVFLRWPGPSEHGVTLTASRSTVRLYPSGVGWGAANTTVVLRKGLAVESLTTSRLGRLRRW